MGKDKPTTPARPHKESEPLQARGPDPRDELPADDGTADAHGKPAGGAHHDKTPRAIVKQVHKHRDLEMGRPKDTGRTGS